MQGISRVFHLLAYYASWIICIDLAAKNQPWWGTGIVLSVALIQVIYESVLHNDTKYLYLLLVILTVVGSLIDTLFLHLNLVTFNANPFSPYFSPPWMISIWISFTVIFFACLKPLFSRYVLLGILSLPGFAIAYYIGAEMGAAALPQGKLSCIVIGLTWAFLLPTCMSLYNYLVKIHD